MKFSKVIALFFATAVSSLALATTWSATNLTNGWHAQRVHHNTSDCNNKVYIHTTAGLPAGAKTGNLDEWNCTGDDSTIDTCTVAGKTYFRCTAKTPNGTVWKVLVENTFSGLCAAQAGDYGWASADVKRTSDTVTPLGNLPSECLAETSVGGSMTGFPGMTDE